MKRILKQLIKLYPSRYITVENLHTVGKHSHQDIITNEVTWQAYVADDKLFEQGTTNWSEQCSSAKELDKYLAIIIKDYKQIYK